MSKKVKKNVPVLRFPEFEEEWTNKNLVEISVSGFSNGVFNDPSKVGRGYRLINVKDMYSGESIDIDTLTRLELEKKEFLNNQARYGDIFFTRSSLVKEGIAHSNVLLSRAEDITYDGHLIKLSPQQNIYLPQFIAAALKNSTSRKQLVARGKTGTMTTIGQEDIATVKLAIPSITEQEKIASFLGAVDTRLTQLRRKHELLQTYKRGVMQKLFSQQIRFKRDDGQPFPDWEKKKLGELGEVIAGLTYSPSDVRKEGLLVLRSSNVQDGKLAFDDCVFVNMVVDSKSLSCEGDILICVRNGSTNLIGKNALITKNIPPSTHGAFMIVFRSDRNSFIFQLFQTDMYKRQVYQDLGARINSINSDRLRKYRFLIPCIEEQEKIADFLTAIDKKIEAVAKQIDLTEQFKKGLLQKMFV